MLKRKNNPVLKSGELKKQKNETGIRCTNAIHVMWVNWYTGILKYPYGYIQCPTCNEKLPKKPFYIAKQPNDPPELNI
jgi:hypothetical protein